MGLSSSSHLLKHISCLVLVHLLILEICHADLAPFTIDNLADYDTHRKWGEVPIQHFQSTEITAPRIIRKTWSPQCDSDSEYYFIGVVGPGVGNIKAGPVILDTDGNTIWHNPLYSLPSTYNVDVQEYKGQKYLTFWSGNDEDRGHGSGFYYMFDQEYRLARTIGAVHGMHADLHEFVITPQGTCIFSVYEQRQWNLSEYKFDTGEDDDGMRWLWDPVVQEIDLETNELLFEWRGLDHIKVRNARQIPGPKAGAYRSGPWDWFHMNSIEKDYKNNYLISGRYYGIIYVSGSTGEILWTLGGKKNQFKDLSHGTATDFMWQHQARWADNRTAISWFNNNALPYTAGQRPTRGTKVRIDEENMTVKTVFDLHHPDKIISAALGGLQNLPNGNVFMGYGTAGALTEWTQDGDIVCDVQFAPLNRGPKGPTLAGAAGSYRAVKKQWVGIPYYPPSVAFKKDSGKMFVSWNGATEVRRWVVDGSKTSHLPETKRTWEPITDVAKAGFETTLKVQRGSYDVLRLKALNNESQPFRCWEIQAGVTLEQISCIDEDSAKITMSTERLSLVGAILFVPFIFLLYRYHARLLLFCTSKAELVYVREKVTGIFRRFRGSRSDYRDDPDGSTSEMLLMSKQDDEDDFENSEQHSNGKLKY